MIDLANLLENDSKKWFSVLKDEVETPCFSEISKFLEEEAASGKKVYPPTSEIFSALRLTPFERVKVVILGQDPYHGHGQAHGLCFSVKPGVRLPPSLRNIFKEIENDLGIPRPACGCLTSWAEQGVLLLNTVLTVLEGKPQSHAKIGWQNFSDRIISELSIEREGIVFLLWGAHAQKKKVLIDSTRHHVLETTHPSPLSAHRGFIGCRHFSKTNQILQGQDIKPIKWHT